MNLDDLAAFLAIAETSPKRYGTGNVRLSDFDGAEVFLSAAMDEKIEASANRLYLNPNSAAINSEFVQRVGPIDVSILGKAIDSDAMFSLGRVKTVRPCDVRGRVRRLSRFMCELSGAFVYTDGSWWSSSRVIWGSNDGARWQLIEEGVKMIDDGRLQLQIKMSLAIAAQRKLDWTVDMGFGPWAKIRIPTDPTGVRTLLRDRKVDAGKSRRSSIVHWVSEHLRKKRNDPSDLIYVREHLRGTREIEWNGMRCTVRPADSRTTCSLCGLADRPMRLVNALGSAGQVVTCMSCAPDN